MVHWLLARSLISLAWSNFFHTLAFTQWLLCEGLTCETFHSFYLRFILSASSELLSHLVSQATREQLLDILAPKRQF
jgi:uncharacterized membrane protein